MCDFFGITTEKWVFVPVYNPHLYRVLNQYKASGTNVSLFGWLVADGWCWFVLREEYYWLVAGGWFVLREKYCWLVVDKPSEQGGGATFVPSIPPDINVSICTGWSHALVQMLNAATVIVRPLPAVLLCSPPPFSFSFSFHFLCFLFLLSTSHSQSHIPTQRFTTIYSQSHSSTITHSLTIIFTYNHKSASRFT
jgi:hypothetical protein